MKKKAVSPSRLIKLNDDGCVNLLKNLFENTGNEIVENYNLFVALRKRHETDITLPSLRYNNLVKYLKSWNKRIKNNDIWFERFYLELVNQDYMIKNRHKALNVLINYLLWTLGALKKPSNRNCQIALKCLDVYGNKHDNNGHKPVCEAF